MLNSQSTSTLDHIIHLSPPGRLNEGVEYFENLGFTVLPGGEHADGLTYNSLVVFSDGTYLELIAFTHEVDYYASGTPEREKRENHWWADKRSGWIDYACLGLDSHVGEIINKRGGGQVDYLPPRDGGRTKPDGIKLQWRVTFPAPVHGRGILPFFCQDVTPRQLRVPLTPSANIHACKARGIAHVKLSTPPTLASNLPEQISAVLGGAPDSSSPSMLRYALQSPHGDEARHPLLVLEAGTLGDTTPGPSIVEVGFHVGDDAPYDGTVTAPPRDDAFGVVVWCSHQAHD